jgi:hypothetical protein
VAPRLEGPDSDTSPSIIQEGFSFAIFDSELSATAYRPREWGMSVQWGLPMLKDCLPPELFDRVYTAANDPNFEPPDPGILPTLNGRTGELLKNVPLLRMYRVSRRRFRSLCSEGIDVQVIRATSLLACTAVADPAFKIAVVQQAAQWYHL